MEKSTVAKKNPAKRKPRAKAKAPAKTKPRAKAKAPAVKVEKPAEPEPTNQAQIKTVDLPTGAPPAGTGSSGANHEITLDEVLGEIGQDEKKKDVDQAEGPPAGESSPELEKPATIKSGGGFAADEVGQIVAAGFEEWAETSGVKEVELSARDEERAGRALAPVINKYCPESVGGEWGEELTAFMVVGPMIYRRIKAIRKRAIEQRKSFHNGNAAHGQEHTRKESYPQDET